MRAMALKLTVLIVALACNSCGAANSLYETGSRMLQSVGRTVTG